MKKVSYLSILFTMALTIIMVNANPIAAQTQEVNIILDNQQCLDIQSGNSRAGAYIVSDACNNSITQTFQMITNPSTGFMTITTKSGLCLELKNGFQGNLGLLNLNNCNGSVNQLYEIRNPQMIGNQTLVSGSIIANGSNKCLDFRGNWLRTFSCNNSTDQSFRFNQTVQNNSTSNSLNDVQFLNSWAVDSKKKLPLTIGDVQLTDAIPTCPFGCVGRDNTNYLSISAWTPRLSIQNVSKFQLEQNLNPFYQQSIVLPVLRQEEFLWKLPIRI